MGDTTATADRIGFSADAQPVGRSIIGGRFVEGGTRFDAVDPRKGAPLRPVCHAATSEQVEQAARMAWQAFHANRARSHEERAKLLELIAERISELSDLLKVAEAETALGQTRLITERQRTTGNLRKFARVVREGDWVRAVVDRGDPTRRPSPKPDLRRMLRPLGPVAVFGASNFPLAYSTMGTDASSALAAGCPVVIKGHPLHPHTGELVGQAVASAVADCGFHPGTFAFLHAGGEREHPIGAALVKHPCIRAVGFTGSVAGGKAMEKLARERHDPIPVFAEMGAVNPVVVLPGAAENKAEAIAEKLAASVSAFVGQQCTRPGLLFVIRSEPVERMVRALADALNQTAAEPMLAQRICERYADRVRELRAIEGVELRAGSLPGGGEGAKATIGSPTVFRTRAETFVRNRTLHDEVFGPSLVVVVCDGEDDLVRAVSVVVGSLTGTIWASDFDAPMAARLQTVFEHRVGRVIYNGVPTGVEVSEAMVHGGPFPATTQAWSTAVGPAAIERWCRPVCYQNAPAGLLPAELRDDNPLRIQREEIE